MGSSFLPARSLTPEAGVASCGMALQVAGQPSREARIAEIGPFSVADRPLRRAWFRYTVTGSITARRCS